MRRALALTLLLTLGAAGPLWVRAQQAAPAPAAPPSPTEQPPAEQPPTEQAQPAPEADPNTGEGETAPAKPTSLQLVRRGDDNKDRVILIERTTVGEGGVFALCGPQEGEPENAPSLAVFSETGPQGVRISIDKNVIRVPLAVVTQRTRENGEAGDGRVEASAGTARFLDEAPEGKTDRLSRCLVEATPKPAPDTVQVTQGKTELKGQNLVYDESDGIARIDGPISFTRPSDDGSLTGTSERIEVNVDEEQTVLVGNVVLNSKGGRVSRAARVEYDDQANVARLYGTPEQPAESRQGNDVLSAQELIYNLDRDEVVVRAAPGGTITGEFQDGEGSAVTSPATSPPAASPSAPPTSPPARP
ncbi:hypothetical protein Dcar01_03052 [Deinococcus carri]|uniref:Organic solvent tolerance-like N-terminal domain-containing protein n=1 Tax=Deinococcus carri TaxID=1211323 RepID=A0ABP9WDI7_9DEIO